MRLLRLLYTCTFLPSQTLRKRGRTIPSSLDGEVWRFYVVHVIRPSSVLTNRKLPQSFHHRKFPVRKPLLHKQRAPQLPTETAEVAEAVWAEMVGVNTGGRWQGVDEG